MVRRAFVPKTALAQAVSFDEEMNEERTGRRSFVSGPLFILL
jgi:hypothetical protein